MALSRSIGSELWAVAALAATEDQVGFDALAFVQVGELESPPPTRGTRDIATFENISTGAEVKEPDIIRAGNGTFMVGFDDTDAGQDILEAAFDSGDKVTVCINIAGVGFYRRAIVTSYNPRAQFGQVVKAEIGLEFEGITFPGTPAS